MNRCRYIKKIKGPVAFISGLFFGFSSCQKKEQPLFTQLSASQTGITFVNEVHDNDSLNILDYLYFYNGGGVSVGDINDDGLPDIFFTANNKGGNKLYLNLGKFKFADITEKAGIKGNADWCTGATMTDVNGDGLLDIYVSAVAGKLNLQGHNELYINNGDQTFTERSVEYGLDFSGFSTQAAFFDYDHDGDLDCYLLNQSDHSVEVYRDTSNRTMMSGKAGDKLFRNDDKKYVDVTVESGIYSSGLGYGLGLAIGDLNNDGWDDIYIGNDFHENDYYYVNNGNGTFTESGAKTFAHYSRFSMGNDIADYNNDGYLDVVTVDMLPEDEKVLKTYGGEEPLDIYQSKIIGNGYQNQYSRNCLQVNVAGGKRFSDVALQAGIAATDWSWSPLFADFDNDGIKDLFISNGIQKRMLDLDYVKFISSPEVQRKISQTKSYDKEILQRIPSGKWHDYFYHGSLTGRFENKSLVWGFDKPGLSNGAAYADLDNDGDLDIVINRVNENAGIYQNNIKGKKYLKLKLKGNKSNLFGVGARAYLFTRKGIQMQELMLTRGFQSSVAPVLYFGLDSLAVADSLIVVWPGNLSQVLHNIPTDKEIELRETDAKDSFLFDSTFKQTTPVLQNVTVSTGLNWVHRQELYYDFNRQFLIPHMLSTEGPKMAVGDVNGDTLDDIYICGTSQQPGTLFMQNGEGKFTGHHNKAFMNDAAFEGVDALFADIDKDGDLDLYVVSGGNKYQSGDSLLLDRLYINNGKGDFVRTYNALPPIAENKSIVIAADVNGDGFPDLFVGGRSNASSYGLIPRSYILINDRKGRFYDASAQWLGVNQELGMTTSAVFTDFNTDGKIDVVVVGDWMPVKFLANTGKSFNEVTDKVAPGKLNGWWYFVSAADVNNDGRIDILLGNYGTNSKLHASAESPLRMYWSDFDNNGNPDQLLCLNKQGNYFPFLGKEELEKQLPVIKKKFLTYGDAAGKAVEEIFDKTTLQKAKIFEAYNMQSGVLINEAHERFYWKAFPKEAQVAPVFSMLPIDLNNDGNKEIIGGGNFYGVLPYEGRYDASDLWMLQFTKPNGKELSPVSTGFYLPGEVRDIKVVRSVQGTKYIVVARNNASIQVFK